MKYILIVLTVLSLAGCEDFTQTQQALNVAEKAVKVAGDAVETATYWHDKYCRTTEGQTDTDCNEDTNTKTPGTPL